MTRIAFLVALPLLLAAPLAAQHEPGDAAAGGELFTLYCAQCHGADAAGNGPMAELIAVPTPDLTALAARNGGVFPLEPAARQIDGRARILAHGGDMPVFGTFFGGAETVMLATPSGQPMAVSRPLADLLTYLASVQAAP